MIKRDYKPTFKDNRLFLPLAYSGCGIGCKYCYIPSPRTNVKPISKEILNADIESAIESQQFISGPTGTVISIGCDTDPLISQETTQLTKEVLSIFKKLRNPIQLSTKCIIPSEIIDYLNSWPLNNPKPILYTSFSTITKVHLIEPHATSIYDRAKNLVLGNGRWLSGAMIKPVLNDTLPDKFLFSKLLASHTPDVIIIGVKYIRQKINGYASHPFEDKWFGNYFSPSELEFAQFLRKIKKPTFYCSLCATAAMLQSSHAIEIFEKHPKLCAKCGLCKSLCRKS